MRPFFFSRLGTESDGPFTILGMDVVGPKVGFLDPTFHRISQNSLGLLAYKVEAKGSSIGFPHDAVNGVDKILILFLTLSYRFFGALPLRDIPEAHDCARQLSAFSDGSAHVIRSKAGAVAAPENFSPLLLSNALR